MLIREMKKEDIPDFVRLAEQLGYNPKAEYVETYLSNRQKNEIVFVACSVSSISGWINCKISQSYLNPPCCEIIGLIVDEKERGKSIGKNLLEAAENWAAAKNIDKIIVRSNQKRNDAHLFYLKNKYFECKTSKVFNKNLKNYMIGIDSG